MGEAERRETRVRRAAGSGWWVTWHRVGHGAGDLGAHPNRSTHGSRSVAGASAQSSCPCFSDTRTSVLSVLPWPRSPAGSLLEGKMGSQRQAVRVEGTHGTLTLDPNV